MSPTQNNVIEAETARREGLNDLVSGGLCLALTIGLAVVHYIQTGRLHDDFNRDPGPALLPVILLIALACAAAGLTLRGILGLSKTQAAARNSIRSGWPAGVAILLMASFLPLRDHFGAAAALMMIGALLALLAGRDEDADWPITITLGASTGLALFALFHFGLSVPL